MATITFYTRTAKKKGYEHINVRFAWGNYMLRMSLGIEIPEKTFDKDKQKLRDVAKVSTYRKKINTKLQDIENFFDDYKNTHVLDRDKLKEDFKNFLNPKKVDVSVVGFIRNYRENDVYHDVNKRTKKRISKSTIKSYKTSENYLVKYEKKFRVKLKFVNLDLRFHNKFLAYMKDELDLSENSCGGAIKHLKKFAKMAEKKGIAINPVILEDDFYKPNEESIAVYLNEEEIEKIYKHDFCHNKRYRNVRNWLIIGVWTGLRISDWSKVGNIENGLIHINTKKTDKPVSIPIHPQVAEIIKDGLPEKVSDVEFNRVIKLVCQEVGLKELTEGSRRNPDTNRKETGIFEKWKLISSHTCRRSFATNVYKSGFPTISLMKITGHTTEKSFLKYIKVTPIEHALKLQNHWKL